MKLSFENTIFVLYIPYDLIRIKCMKYSVYQSNLNQKHNLKSRKFESNHYFLWKKVSSKILCYKNEIKKLF